MKTGTPILFLGLLFAAYGCNKNVAADKQALGFALSDTIASMLEFSTAELAPVKRQLQLSGKVSTDENNRIEVFPLVGGYVKEVRVELGDYVEKGSVLAVINSGEIADYEQQRLAANSNVVIAQKNLELAKDMYSSKLASERDYINAKNEADKAQGELKKINEIFRIYNLGNSSDYVVRAPISGFVVEKKINRDMQIRAENNDKLFTVAQLNEVWVMVNVYETDIAQVKEGIEAKITTLSYPNEVFVGKVDKVFNVLDPESKVMKARIKLNNTAYKLKPEMFANVSLNYTEAHDEKVEIPSSAIIFDKSKHYVMVYHDSKHIETREIELYREVGPLSYVERGLKPGEKLISKYHLMVYDALND